MKTMTCAQMGGPCDTIFMARTAEEMTKKGADHAASMSDEGHKKLAAKVKAMSIDDNVKSMVDFQKTFDAEPDM